MRESVRKAALVIASTALTVIALSTGNAQERSVNAIPSTPKELEIGRGLTTAAQECIACHAKHEPGKVNDWSHGIHARSNITCIDCHQAELTDTDARDCPGTEKYRELKISPIVSPEDCSRCHPEEELQFSLSKHARTWQIQTDEIKDPWLKGMTNAIERSTGCYICHGSDIRDGELTVLNWPNEGSGRMNPDGSNGSCVICHTTHRFSIAEARKPETCGQCHLGPDHPQEEIYFESKHGKRYLAEQNEWRFDRAPDAWEPASDFTAPTCAACHMSGIGGLATSHDVGQRLKWEAQTPLSVTNKDYDGEKEREAMIAVCTQCHSPRWAGNYLERYDLAIQNYNEEYFLPVRTIMNGLYEDNILTEWPMFDEEIEWVFYEIWHHEGRRARMGSAMMGPDYSWWHGFYDLKHSYQKFVRLAQEARERGHGTPVYVPGTGGENRTPDVVEPFPELWETVPNLTGIPE